MTFPRSPSGSQSRLTGKQQTRLLFKNERLQRCTSPGCFTPAAGEHTGQLYCPAHFLTALQQQWQE
jgi:hypothetical protein